MSNKTSSELINYSLLIFLGALPHESIPARDNKKTIVSGNIQYQ